MSKVKAQISKKGLEELMDKGYSREEMAEHYGIPVIQIKAALKSVGLHKKRAKTTAFIIVPDDVENTPAVVTDKAVSITPSEEDVKKTPDLAEAGVSAGETIEAELTDTVGSGSGFDTGSNPEDNF